MTQRENRKVERQRIKEEKQYPNMLKTKRTKDTELSHTLFPFSSILHLVFLEQIMRQMASLNFFFIDMLTVTPKCCFCLESIFVFCSSSHNKSILLQSSTQNSTKYAHLGLQLSTCMVIILNL